MSVCHICSARPCLRESLYMSGLVSVLLSHILSLVDEEVDELLNLLVDTFSLAVCLWVVGSGGHNLNPEYLTEAPHEVQHKLGSSVTNHTFQVLGAHVVSRCHPEITRQPQVR